MNQILNPKDRFRKSAGSKMHLELVVSDVFRDALEAALSHMTLNMPKPENPSKAWDNGCQLAGANRFIEILLNLAEVEPDRPKIDERRNLRPTD